MSPVTAKIGILMMCEMATNNEALYLSHICIRCLRDVFIKLHAFLHSLKDSTGAVQHQASKEKMCVQF